MTQSSVKDELRMKYKILLLLFVSPYINAEPLFYFHAGSSWTYQVDGYKNYKVTNKVTEVKTIDGQNWYKLLEYGETFWVTNKEGGQFEAVNFFEKSPSQIDKAEEVLVFKFPAKIGEKWNNNSSPTTYLGVQTIIVPAGEFQCHMYNIDMGQSNYSNSCIAKDVGVVFNEAQLENKPKETSKLLYYKQ